jgi:hypothetical protein
MTQHTPGPWATSKGAYGALHVGPAKLEHPGRDMVAYAAERGRDLLAQRAADAALIAAAPDMLAALEAFVGSRKGDGMGWTLDSLEALAREAIAKARGA